MRRYKQNLPRRGNRIKNKKNKETKIKRIKIFLYISLILLVSFFVYIIFKISSLEKFIFVNNVNGSAEINVVDSTKLEIIKIIIPENTQITSSRGLGIYKISSLWKLGEKEGYKGKLMAESVRRNFLIPLYLWKDENKTNLNPWQNIKIFFLERGFLNYQITKINLSEIKVLKKKNFSDGTNGFVISSKLPESILINFVENTVAESIFNIEIEDLTKNINSIEDISKILGVMGGKITSYSKGLGENIDCEVIAKDKELAKIISENFDCSYSINTKLSVDLKIRLGKTFVQRF